MDRICTSYRVSDSCGCAVVRRFRRARRGCPQDPTGTLRTERRPDPMQEVAGPEPLSDRRKIAQEGQLRVISLDPGITTGYCVGEVKNKELEFVCGEGRWTHKDLYNWLDRHEPNVVVYETFEYRNRQRDGLELYSKELIGVIQLFAQIADEVGTPEVKLVSQHPGQVMGFFTNPRLKKEGCYYPNSEHPRDATRHLLHWWKFGHGSQYADMDARTKINLLDYRMTGIIK